MTGYDNRDEAIKPLKTKKIKPGIYQIVGTDLTIEREDIPKRWGDPYQPWIICNGEALLAECNGKRGCMYALEKIFAEMSKLNWEMS